MTFPAGLTTIEVTGQNVLGLDGSPLSGVVIFTASGPVGDPGADAVLDGAAVGNVTGGQLEPLTIPTTDCVEPAFTYTITVRLADADGSTGGPPPLTGVQIPHTLGESVDLSSLL